MTFIWHTWTNINWKQNMINIFKKITITYFLCNSIVHTPIALHTTRYRMKQSKLYLKTIIFNCIWFHSDCIKQTKKKIIWVILNNWIHFTQKYKTLFWWVLYNTIWIQTQSHPKVFFIFVLYFIVSILCAPECIIMYQLQYTNKLFSKLPHAYSNRTTHSH